MFIYTKGLKRISIKLLDSHLFTLYYTYSNLKGVLTIEKND